MGIRGKALYILMFWLLVWPEAFALDQDRWPAPEFTAKDLEGKTLSLSELKGKVVVVHFWATWCTSCRDEMPSLEEFSRAYEPLGVRVLAVTSEGSEERVRDFYDCLPPYYTVILDKTSKIRQLYGIRGIPVTLLVDRSGMVVKRYNGKQDWQSEELLADIEELLED